ncbi:YadA C-terminal domain-containing protein [Photobacterium kishitanii]|uniref:YadA C-terminal domain-containing protein n=1 Tax=Photobacterium kishitanii TaxID=318456 RepID=UPI0027395EDD|nr:YadA C-terminal domain-containing protein [Photobacterium kishitanii]
MNFLTQDIEKVHNQANAGIASAMAMSSIPMKQGYHYTIGLGAANYDNQSAIALGGKFDVSQHSIVTLAASDNSLHDAGVSAGVGFGF